MKQFQQLLLGVIFALSAQVAQSQVTVDFSADDLVVCPGSPVFFSDLCAVPLGYTITYAWNFPGGFATSTTTANPTVFYYTPGTYSVSLTITVAGLGSFTLSKPGYIQVVEPSIAGATYSFPDICNQLAVSFASTSTAGGAPITSYLWDFDDGTFSASEDPMKTYSSPGTYDVILFITDGNGCSDNFTLPVTVSAPLSSNMSVTGATFSCGASVTPTISAITSGGTIPYSYEWDYGNGTTSTLPSSSVTYTDCGEYDITYTVTDANGCSVTHTYNNYIRISCPVADFDMGGDSICQNGTVFFDNLSTPGATSYLWQFNFPAATPSSTLAEPSNTFAAPGLKQIKLTATYPGGCVDTHMDTITILPKPVIAGLIATDSTACEVPFTSTFSTGGITGTGPFDYLWDFDGITSTDENPTITFTATVNYDVTLTVTDANGCTTTVTMTNFIKIKKPDAEFTATPLEGCAPMEVTFTNLSSSDYDGLDHFVWVYDDGTTETLSDLGDHTHVFTDPGTYHVEMTLFTEEGCERTKTMNIYVGEIVADFDIPEDTACNPIQLDNMAFGSEFTTINWGDDLSISVFPPSSDTVHFYAALDTTTYFVEMICENDGCTSYAYDTITVLPMKLAALTSWDCDNPTFLDITIDTTIIFGDFCIDFNNGDTICYTNPIHYDFGGPGNYEMYIIPLDSVLEDDCPVAMTFYGIIPDVDPSYTASTYGVCGTGVVNFTNTSVVTDTEIFNYTWEVGPGVSTGTYYSASSVVDDFSYNFTVGDIYPVTLTLTDINLCTFSYTDTIYVGSPVSAFVVDSITGCSPKTMYLTSTSGTLGSGVTIVTYVWNFDGAAPNYVGEFPPPVIFPNGIYDVKLTVLDNFGCTDVYIETFDFSNVLSASYIGDSLSCNVTDPLHFENTSTGDYDSILWNYGDGTTDTTFHGDHMYATEGNYIVSLTVSDTLGCIITYIDSFDIVFDNLIADFDLNYLTSATCPPVPLQLINTSTGDVADFLWEVERETGTYFYTFDTLVFTYTVPGDYDVALYVTSTHGCTDTLSIPNAIDIPGPFGYMASFPAEGCLPLEVTFNIDSVNADLIYIDFGDGDTLQVTGDVTHTYTTSGSFCPSLILLDSSGCSFEVNCTSSIEVYDSPLADIYLTDSSLCIGETATIYNATIDGISDPSTDFELSFGDGSSLTTDFDSIDHDYPLEGSYLVTFITSNDHCSDTATTTVLVNTFPTAEFSYTPYEGCYPLTVYFTLTGVTADDVLLEFGDGNSAYVSGDTSYTYTTAGEFIPGLILNSSSGCDQPIIGDDTIRVSDIPVAAFIVSDSAICEAETITIYNTDTSSLYSPTINYTIDF
ncbi:MAG: PKD domain-containing protein, partial [Chitinophagales bacterium]|nr:PKD domain-containing protein [Chitinophagales bacterium]